MSNTCTAIFERDGEWHIAYCPEVPGANGQGRTKREARESLADAIELIQQDRLDDALRGLPDDAEEAVPRHVEIPDRLAEKICRELSVPKIGG